MRSMNGSINKQFQHFPKRVNFMDEKKASIEGDAQIEKPIELE